MNIIEAYIKFNKTLIIFISGLSGCNKTALAKELADTLHIEFMDTHKYYLEKYDNKITLSDGTEVINYDTDDAYDWDAINKRIKELKSIVVSGVSFPSDKLDVKPALHIHLNISKQTCLAVRREFMKNNGIDNVSDDVATHSFNKYTYPYYLESMKKSVIDKFINITDMNDDTIGDQLFNFVISFVQKKLYDKQPSNKQHEKHTKTDELIHDGTINMKMTKLVRPKYTYDEEMNMVQKLYRPLSSSDVSSDVLLSSDDSDRIHDGPIVMDTHKKLSRFVTL